MYRQAFQVCGDAEGVIAMETLQMEVEVENQVIQQLSTLVDVDVPNIQKLRKQLTSRTLDMDSARAQLVSLCVCLCVCLYVSMSVCSLSMSVCGLSVCVCSDMAQSIVRLSLLVVLLYSPSWMLLVMRSKIVLQRLIRHGSVS